MNAGRRPWPEASSRGFRPSEHVLPKTVSALALLGLLFGCLLRSVPAAEMGPGCAGSLDPSFNAGSDLWPNLAPTAISSITVQPDGRILIAGLFQLIQGLWINSPARLHPDGSLDASFRSALDAGEATRSLVLPDGRILAGVPELHRLDETGALDPTFLYARPTGFSVTAFALQPDGRIVIAGTLGSLDPDNPRFDQIVARLDPDGSPDPAFPTAIIATSEQPPEQPLASLVIQADGKLLLNGLHRLNPDGTPDPSYTVALPPGFEVKKILLQPDNRILVAGGVYYLDPVTYAQSVSQAVLRLLPNGALDPSFATNINVSLMPGEWTAGEKLAVYDLVQQPDGRFYLSGFFTAVNGVRRTILARFHADGILDAGFQPDVEVHTGHDPGIVETISALALQPDEKLLGAGFLERINGLRRGGIARFHTAPDGCPGIIRLEDPIIYVHEYQGQVSLTLSRFADTSQPAAVFYATDRYNAHPAVCCHFEYATADQDYQAQFGVIEFAPGETTKSVTLTLLDDLLLESSEQFFLNLGFATNSSNAAVLTTEAASTAIMIHDDETTGLPGSVDDGFNQAGLNGPVSTIILAPDNTVLIAGSFTRAGGAPCPGLARFNLSGQLIESFALDLNGDIRDLVVDPATGDLFVAGEFTAVNGIPRLGLAKLNPEGALDPAFNAGLDGPAWKLELLSNGQIIIGGPFTSVAGSSRAGLARLHPDGSLDPDFDAGSGIGPWTSFYQVYDFAEQPDGRLLLTGRFRTVGSSQRPTLARLHTDGSVDTSFAPSFFDVGDYGSALLILPDGRILLSGWLRYGRDGIYHIGIVRLLQDGSIDPSFLIKTRPQAFTMTLQQDGKILYGGGMRLNPDGTEDPNYYPGTGFGYTGASSLVLLPDGDAIVGGSFTAVNGYPYPYLVRLHADPAPQALGVGRTSSSGNAIQLTLTGDLGARFLIEGSTDLQTWSPVLVITNTSPDGQVEFKDPNQARFPCRYYRSRLQY